jgi:hypothetical protein
LGIILGKGFTGSGYLGKFTSLQASTQASQPIHLLISIRVAKCECPLSLDAADGRLVAAKVPTAARPPFKKDLRDSLVVISIP